MTILVKEQIINIIVEGFANEKTDNDIKKEMFMTEEIDFGDINKTFLQVIAEKGLRLSSKDRTTKTNEFLEGYEPDGVENHLAKISALQDHLNCATTMAGAAMRKWAKTNEIDLPKAPKESAVEPGFRGNIKTVADFAIANKDCTLEDLVKFASESVPNTKTGKDNSRAYAIGIWNAVLFAHKYNAEVVEEVELEEAA